VEPAHLLAFNAAPAAAMASPGPALLHALRVSLAEGRAAGILTGVGLGAMAAAWTGLALLGLGQLFALVPWLYGALRIVGALYLLWIAWTIWRGADAPVGPVAGVAPGRAVLRGLAINLANPKSALFAAAVLVVIFPAGLGPAEMALIVANHLAVEILFYGAVALILSHGAARAAYLESKPLLDRIAGGILGLLGLRLLLDRP